MSEMYTNKPSLRERVNAKILESDTTKAGIGAAFGVSRSVISNYLNKKPVSISRERMLELELWLENWLEQEGEATCYKGSAAIKEQLPINNVVEPIIKQFCKPEIFETSDFRGIIGLCTLCQENQDLGIVVGRSGYGKTYSLKYYAKLPKVIHIECNETMNNKDIIRRIEEAIRMPKGYGSIDERMRRICDYFNTNRGYLLIVDEADKLLSKYTIKKIELIRNIADGAAVGVVLAGEPALESSIKAFDDRFANRMGLIYRLKGLSKKEVEKYFSHSDIKEDALTEFYQRACNKNTGCFRLLDRTLNNVMRILKTTDKNQITYETIQEASSMMVL